MIIREIEQKDNVEIATLIREVLTEFGVNRPGTVFTDPTTDHLFELFSRNESGYFIAESDGKIVGGCGLFPTIGLPEGCVELVKLYVNKGHRHTGLGKQLMGKTILAAKNFGFNSLYLETMPELSNAIKLYEKLGFKTIDKQLGDTQHFACKIWMLKELN